jgi:hypothetical protein
MRAARAAPAARLAGVLLLERAAGCAGLFFVDFALADPVFVDEAGEAVWLAPPAAQPDTGETASSQASNKDIVRVASAPASHREGESVEVGEGTALMSLL